ncbi:MAG: alpha/beta hydrolase, partial [Pseudomonadota bacterium]
MKILIIVFILLALLLGIPYIAAGWGEKPLTDQERAIHAPGKTITIDGGVIHYVERGPIDAPVIVMVHGFSTPHFIFEQNAAALADAGFRVIQFDHFGRGWSDRPNASYDIEFYDDELLNVLDALELDAPVGLVGLSMGGVITAEFMANHAGRVSGLFLLVSAGLSLSSSSDGALTKLIKTPIVGDWLWRLFARSTLLGDSTYDDAGLAEVQRLQGDVTRQMDFKGYFPALLSSLRN